MKNTLITFLFTTLVALWYLDVTPTELVYLLEILPNYLKYKLGV